MKQMYIKEDHISKIDTFLCKAYNAAKSGYVKTSMSELARNAGVTVKVSDTLFAVKNLGILKQRGERRAAMWYWPGGEPTIDIAEKVYNEVRRIGVNKNISKTVSNKAKANNLVPIVGSARPGKLKTPEITRERATEIIDLMIKNTDVVFTLASAMADYNVTELFFTPLIELDIIQKFDRIPGGFYKLCDLHSGNKSVVIDLIMEAYHANSKNKEPRKKLDLQSADERASAVTAWLETIQSKPYNGSMRPLLDKHGLATVYQTVASRMGYIQNTGSNTKPVYITKVPVTNDVALSIVSEVREYWSSGHLPTPSTSFIDAPVVSKPHVISTQTSETDLNAMLERAVKHKAYLETELTKVDKIIENANTIMRLTAELQN